MSGDGVCGDSYAARSPLLLGETQQCPQSVAPTGRGCDHRSLGDVDASGGSANLARRAAAARSLALPLTPTPAGSVPHPPWWRAETPPCPRTSRRDPDRRTTDLRRRRADL